MEVSPGGVAADVSPLILILFRADYVGCYGYHAGGCTRFNGVTVQRFNP